MNDVKDAGKTLKCIHGTRLDKGAKLRQEDTATNDNSRDITDRFTSFCYIL